MISAVIFIFYWPLVEALAGAHGTLMFRTTRGRKPLLYKLPR